MPTGGFSWSQDERTSKGKHNIIGVFIRIYSALPFTLAPHSKSMGLIPDVAFKPSWWLPLYLCRREPLGATSHSVWGYCPSHKRNQLVSSRPHATRAQPSVKSPPFVVFPGATWLHRPCRPRISPLLCPEPLRGGASPSSRSICDVAGCYYYMMISLLGR